MDIDEFIREVIELLSLPLPPKKPPTHIQTSEFVGWWFPEILVGTTIRIGEKIGIVKVFDVENEIFSQVSGKIIKISPPVSSEFPKGYPPKGYPIEYSEPLFEIEIAS